MAIPSVSKRRWFVKPAFVARIFAAAAPVFFIMLLSAAQAATITVNTTADEYGSGGSCSLREAITAANNDAAFGGCPAGSGADVINLPAGTYTLTIANPGGNNEDNNAAGDLDINTSLTIQGAGSGSTIIQAGTTTANGIDKVIGVNPYCNAGVSVTIDGVTIRYGRNTQTYGAADFSYTGGGLDWCGDGAGSFTLSNATVADNTNVNGYGGGLNIDSTSPYTGAINITNVLFQNNKTQGSTGGQATGGAVNIFGADPVVTITNSQFLGNVAATTTAGGGGVFYRPSFGGSLQIHNAEINGNTAGGNGGGVYLDTYGAGDVVTIDQGTQIINNVSGGVTNGSAGGGGIFIGSSALTATPITLSKVVITGNSESALSNPSARQGGGGILVQQANVKVEYSRITGNTVLSANGGTGLYKNNDTGAVTATNNWWGCSTGPGSSPCDTAVLESGSSGSLTSAPYLRLLATASPSTIATNESTTVTASFATNSAGTNVSANIDRLIGLGVTWSAAGGSLSGQQAAIQAGGTATASYTAAAAAAGNQAAAVVGSDTTAAPRPNVAQITVNKANTSAAISSDTPDPSRNGTAVTVGYTVIPATGSTPTAPTGTVTVSDGIDSCTGTIAAGSCDIILNTPGSRTLTATYNGDRNFNASPASAGAAHFVITPEMSVEGNGVEIVAGDSTPSGTDYTDFGAATAGCSTVTRTFTIRNTGDATLNLSGTPRVAVSGTNAADFTVTLQPSTPVVITNGTTTFQVQFSPSAGGLRSADISIANDDINENPYNFSIQGTGSVLGATTSQTNLTCNGVCNGSAGVTPSGGTAPYTYSWAPSGGTAATAFSLCAGSYTCTITDASGCIATKTVTVTQPAAVTSSISSQTNVSCNGGSNGAATVSASGGTPGYTYSWAPSGGTAATASGLVAGTYTCTITDANGCTKMQVATITQPFALTATNSQINVSCNGGSNGSATVSASGGTPSYAYSWAPSGGTAATASGLAAGTYTCTITDANTCSITKTFTLTQPSALVVSAASQTNVSCNGGSNGAASVNAATGGTGPYTYNWTPGNPTGDGTTSVTGLTAGSWTCTVTDANSCTATRTFAITQPTAIASSVSSQTNVSCNGGSNGAAMVNASGGTGTLTYSWAPSGGTAATATGLAAGIYTCTITDANGCIKTQIATITQPSAISATTSQSNVSCNGGSNGSATVSPSGGTPGYTYSWAPSGGTAATASGLTVGTYTCTVTDANTCSITKTFTLTQPSAITATTSQSNVSCNGGSNGSATVSPSGGTPGYTYSWAPSGGTAATASGLTAGSYTCTITDANTCSITKTFTLTQPSAITSSVSSQNNVSCNGGSNGAATINAGGGTGMLSYSWAPSGGTAATASGLVAGTYACTITDANGCTKTQTATITQPTAISATTSQANVTANGGTDGTATVTPSGGTPGYTYSWAPSGGTAATATGLAEGSYTCTITDANSCTATRTFTITQPATPTVAFATASQASPGETGTMTITVQLSAASALTVTVPFTVNAASTATGGGTDYSITASPVTIFAGQTTGTITITIVDDTLDENDETVIVDMGNPVNAAQGSITTHTATITDDDAPPSLSINDQSVAEGDSGTANLTFTVSLSAVSGKTVTVDYATADNTATTADTDYLAASGTLTFTPGQASQTITVTVNGDTKDEADETLYVNLSNAANATLSDGQGAGTIQNDEKPDMAVQAETLSIAAVDDGQVRISGSVTISNAGNGSLKQDVAVRFTVYGGSGCSGSQLAQWTQTLASVDLDPLTGSQTFTITDHDAAVNICAASHACAASIGIEIDPANAIAESNETNNTGCYDTTAATANLAVSSISATPECSADASFTGITVTVANTGCADASGVKVQLVSDCGLSFADQTVDLAAGASQDIIFALSDAISTCNCTLTATIDPDSAIDECDAADNVFVSGPSLSIPDLAVDNESLVVGCTDNGTLKVQGTVTLRNNGCGPALTADVPVRLTLHDGSGCSGTQIAVLQQNFSSVEIASGGGRQTFTVAYQSLASDFCTTATHDDISVFVEADDNQTICEWSGDNNTRCSDKVVGNIDDTVRCRFALDVYEQSFDAAGGTGTVEVSVSDSNCPWTAASSTDWITLTSGPAGIDNSTVSYSVAVNTGPARTGVMTAAGKTFTVSQGAATVTTTTTIPVRDGCLTVVPSKVTKLLRTDSAAQKELQAKIGAQALDPSAIIALLKLAGYAIPLQGFIMIGDSDTVFTRMDRPQWNAESITTLMKINFAKRFIFALVFINPFTAEAGSYQVTVGDCSGMVELREP